jgi:uncharacterized membrane protein
MASMHCSPLEEGMTTMQRDRLVDDYLRRLEAAAADLPHERRVELVTEIEEHIQAALREGDVGNETAVRNVLERLGPPDEIAAEAGAATPAPERGRLETAAMVVLAVSFVLPFLGYFIGAGLVLASQAWDGHDKAIALVIPPFIVVVGGLVVLAGAASVAEGDSFHSGLGPVEVAVLMASALSGLLSAAYLSHRLRRPKPA